MKIVLIKYWPALFIFSVWILFSYPYFFNGLIPFPSNYLTTFFNPWINYFGMASKNNAMPDVITQIYPWKQITIDSLRSGALPLWNPYQFSGNPLLANFQSAVFSPFNLLFFIVPFIDAWSMLVLFQPLLAGLFMYMYLRIIERSRTASVIGAISFMFSSFIVTWMAYGTLGYALLFLPLILYGIERLYVKNDKSSFFIILISIPLTLFSGHFQTSIYVILVGISYAVLRYFISRQKKAAMWAAMAFVVGLIISSLQLMPTYRLYELSPRSESYIGDEAIPWVQLVRIIAPDFFGNPVTRNDWVGYYAEWGTYAGVVAIFLALLALFRKNKHTLFFSSVAVISLLFAFESRFVELLAYSKIPVLSTSTPSRIVSILSFSIAALAAFGFDFLTCEWRKNAVSKRSIIVLSIFIVVFGGIWILLLNQNVLFIGSDIEKVEIARRNMVIPTALFIVTAVTLFAGFSKIKYVKFLAIIVIIVLSSFEMLRFSTKWMPFESREYMYPEVAPLNFLQKNAGVNRVYGLIGNEVFGSFGLYGIEGYDPLYIQRYGEFLSTADDGSVGQISRSSVVFPRTGIYSKKMLDLLGVKYILHSKGDGQGSWLFPFWNYPESFKASVFSDERYEVYENESAYPRTYMVHKYHIYSEPDEIIAALYSESIDLRKEVILEKSAPTSAEELNNCVSSTSNDSALIKSYKPSHITIQTESECPSILFLSDVYYPGWNAYVDGEKVEIMRANYTFRAVPLPRGTHTVIMKYENWYL